MHRRHSSRNKSKNNKGTQYITKSNTSPKKYKVSECYKQDTNAEHDLQHGGDIISRLNSGDIGNI